MTDIEKDVRAVLLGRTALLEDGRLTNYVHGEFNIMSGVSDGAGSVLFFGMAKRSRAFKTRFSEQKALNAARSAMMEIGRGVVPRSDPEMPACLIRYILTKPVVLTFKYVEGVPVVTAYSGRSLTALISLRRAIAAFTDELPDGMTAAEEKAPEEEKEEKPSREERRAKKKEAKAKAKAEAAAKAAAEAEAAAQAAVEKAAKAAAEADTVTETVSETIENENPEENIAEISEGDIAENIETSTEERNM